MQSNETERYHEFEDNSAEWDMALDKEVLATTPLQVIDLAVSVAADITLCDV